MSRIDANIQSLLTQRSQLSNANPSQALDRLGVGLRFTRGSDEFTPSAAANAQNTPALTPNGLREVSALLGELEELVAASQSGAALSADQRAANQQRVDTILGSIDQVASARGFSALGALREGPAYDALNVNERVEQFAVYNADIPAGERLNVDVSVTQSAQAGGFFLSFGGANIDLGSAGETFEIEISGANGSQVLSFASGTSVASIRAAINTFTDSTGVTASSIGTGLFIRSENVGSDEFVGIKVLDDGDFAPSGTGIYNLSATDTNVVNTAIATTFGFASIADPFIDYGQDIQGTINGIEAEGRGAGLSLRSESLTTRIELTRSGAQSALSFRAFRLEEAARDATRGFDITSSEALGAVRRASEDIAALLEQYENAPAPEPTDLTRRDILASAASSATSAGRALPQSVLELLG